MPFSHAAQIREKMMGIQRRVATVRRHTEHAGKMAEEVQDLDTQQACQAECSPLPDLAPMVISADGAFVPFVGGVWAEARTRAIGTVTTKHAPSSTTNRSSFSRMTDAATFTSTCPGEMHRRHLLQTSRVAGVMDGAEWVQGLLDVHLPNAIRLLDFPHAGQRVSAILEAAQQAGQLLPTNARERSLHVLTHRGPRPLLRWVSHLTRSLAATSAAHDDLASLHKRAALMQSPPYHVCGWPIGSGMVERANTRVVEARLKGAGMHWAPTHVNPLLALRSAVCSDRWDATWEEITAYAIRQRQQRRNERTTDRQRHATSAFLLAWMRFLLPHRPVLPCEETSSQLLFPQEPAKMVAGRPTAHHPWKRALATLSAKQ